MGADSFFSPKAYNGPVDVVKQRRLRCESRRFGLFSRTFFLIRRWPGNFFWPRREYDTRCRIAGVWL